MIAEDREGKDYLDKVREDKLILGYEIGCELDNHLRFKRNGFNIIAGHANVGKTLWILYYYLCVANNHGMRFCMYMAENDIEDIKWDLIELFTKSKVKDLSEMQYDAALQWVNHHFKFIDHEGFYKKKGRAMSHKDVLKSFEQTDLECLVIDPWNSLYSDSTKNGHQADYEAATDLRMFCKINNRSIYILAHGVTDALRKVHPQDHEYGGHTKPLMAADIEGGGKWVNRADDFIIIHRYTQHPTDWMLTEIHVRKVKKTRTGGKPTFLDSPVRFKYEKGLSFTVNGVNPMTGVRQPEQMEIQDNKVLNNWYEKDDNLEEGLPF